MEMDDSERLLQEDEDSLYFHDQSFPRESLVGQLVSHVKDLQAACADDIRLPIIEKLLLLDVTPSAIGKIFDFKISTGHVLCFCFSYITDRQRSKKIPKNIWSFRRNCKETDEKVVFCS